MTTATLTLTRPTSAPWKDPAEYWPGLGAATAGLETPFGALSVEALAANAFDLLDRASGMPIRVASKSVRVRGVLDAVLTLPGYRGILAYTLPEALWLADGDAGHDDVVVGYPSVDRSAIAQLGADARLAARVTLMIDDLAQLDLIDAVIAPARRAAPIRLALELDSSYESALLGHVGVRRSPIHTADAARTLAAAIVQRPGFRLVGMMGYEAQIAGLTNKGSGRAAARAAVIRRMQRASAAELADRRGAAVAAVRNLAELEFVNGGGTGSFETTRADASVTELAAGSGLFGPHLFDGYVQFTPAPAAAFALSVVRRPTPEVATLLGGGWIASGPTAPDRQPQLVWPEGLTTLGREASGEVQTPVTGAAAARLSVGDRVWLRHTKAGELSEHLNAFALVSLSTPGAGHLIGELPTYRGEGKAFL